MGKVFSPAGDLAAAVTRATDLLQEVVRLAKASPFTIKREARLEVKLSLDNLEREELDLIVKLEAIIGPRCAVVLKYRAISDKYCASFEPSYIQESTIDPGWVEPAVHRLLFDFARQQGLIYGGDLEFMRDEMLKRLDELFQFYAVLT